MKITVHEIGKEQITRDMTEEELNVYNSDMEKINQDRQKLLDEQNKRASGKQKLLDLGLTEEEIKALIGV